jgi:hypothetical protein
MHEVCFNTRFQLIQINILVYHEEFGKRRFEKIKLLNRIFLTLIIHNNMQELLSLVHQLLQFNILIYSKKIRRGTLVPT